MKLFDNKGFLVIPNPKDSGAQKVIQAIVVQKCFCLNGHNLVSKQAKFNQYSGIVLTISKNEKVGTIALSPIFGEKSKITFGIELEEGDLIDLSCPKCNAKLPVYSSCECGGDLLIMFTGELKDFNNCIGVCNRVGCIHSEIINEGGLLNLTAPELF